MTIKNLLTIGSISFIFFACGTQKSEPEATTTDSSAVAEAPKPTESEAVCIWDKVSVRATPSDDGKWLTSISIGESLTYLNEESKDKEGKVHYKVRLNDGKEGWSRSEFIVPDARSAVFVNESDLYNRADLLTKSDKKFSKMDIVAVKQAQDDWVEITGKRSDGKWIDNGWVKSGNLSFEPVDIAMAKFAKPVLEDENADNKEQKLEDILSNGDLSSSVFMADLKEALDEIKLASGAAEVEETAPATDDQDSTSTEEVEEQAGQ